MSGSSGPGPLEEQVPGESGPGYIRQDAQVSGSGSVIQSGRDTHYYYRDGVRHLRWTEGPVVTECPYPGLASFTAEQGHWFFGRTRMIAELVSRLDSSMQGGPLVLVAPSGAGKSSLLKAGLLPALERGALPVPGSREWPRLVFTPTAHPITAAAVHIAALTGADPSSTAAELAADPVRGAAALRAALLNRRTDGAVAAARAVMVIDQLEELFTLCTDEAERHAFIELLAQLAAPAPGGVAAAVVICGLRADFYAPCTQYPQLRAALQGGQILLGPMSESGLRETILYPAESVGLEVEPGLVELLLRDIGASGGGAGYAAGRLPLLAHALRETWQQRHGSTLTVDAYLATGGIQHAVATTADRVLATLDASARETARWVFLRLVKIGDGAMEDTRRRAARTDLLDDAADPAAARAVVDAFTAARLLTQEQDTVEITHEALLRAWPSLRQWIDVDRAGNLVRQELEDDAAGWDRQGRDPSALYRGSRLAAARRLSTSGAQHASLSPDATAFLAASGRQENRATWIRRAAVTVLVALVLVASSAAFIARNEKATVQTQRDDAQSAVMAATATALYDSDPGLARQIGLAAFRLYPSPEAYGSLLNAAVRPLAGQLLGKTTSFDEVSFSADGSMLAVGSTDAIQLWHFNAADSTDPSLVKTIRSVQPVNSSPQVLFKPGSGAALSVIYDGSGFVAANDQFTLGHSPVSSALTTVAASRDGRVIAGGFANGNVGLFDATDPASVHAIGLDFRDPKAPNVEVSKIAFSPDGSLLATLSGPVHDGHDINGTATVRLWDITDLVKPRLLSTTLTSVVRVLAFSPVRDILATGTSDNTVQLWDVSNASHPEPAGPPMVGHAGLLLGAAFSGNGKTMVTIAIDGSIRLWDVSNPGRPAALAILGRGPTTPYFASVAISPDGHLVAATGPSSVNGTTVYETYLWKIDSSQATAANACAAIGSRITETQWKQYIPHEAYNPPCP